MGVGTYLATDFLTQPYGLQLAGFIMIGVGAYITIGAIIGFIGACKQSSTMLSINLYWVIGQCLLALVMMGLVFSAVKKPEQLRLAWNDIREKPRGIIEQKLMCCGYDDLEDGIQPCKFKKTCSDFVPKQFAARVGTATGVGAVALLAGALNLFAVGCLRRKMSKYEGKARKKAFTSLADEARGIDRSKHERHGKKPHEVTLKHPAKRDQRGDHNV
jgi:hypothetical protein